MPDMDPTQLASSKKALLATGDARSSRGTAQSCGVLSLPAELRNIIYQLYFTTKGTDDGTRDFIHLFKCRPPTKSLLLTCRKIYNDAVGMYKTAYRSYWRDNSFIVHSALLGEHRSWPGSAPCAEDIENITSLLVMLWPYIGDSLTVNEITTKEELQLHTSTPRLQWELHHGVTWSMRYGHQLWMDRYLVAPYRKEEERYKILRFEANGPGGFRTNVYRFEDIIPYYPSMGQKGHLGYVPLIDQIWEILNGI